MLHFIEKLRQKSDRTKKQYAFLLAFLFAGLIFVVWLSVLYPTWYRAESKEAAVSKLEPGPFESLRSLISNGVSSIAGEVDKAKEVVSSIASSTMASSSQQQ